VAPARRLRNHALDHLFFPLSFKRQKAEKLTFASKVRARSGSALPPDVMRRLRPAVEVLFYIWAFALGAAFGPMTVGLGSDQGHSEGNNLLLSAGQSHRLTSSGKAEVAPTENF
jgi:hypothetical protein